MYFDRSFVFLVLIIAPEIDTVFSMMVPMVLEEKTRLPRNRIFLDFHLHLKLRPGGIHRFGETA